MTAIVAGNEIPLDNGLWPLKYTIGFYRDLGAATRELYRRRGPVARVGWGPFSMVSLLGPDANQLVLQNRDDIFSSRHGWGWVIDHVFPGAVMTMDGDQHRFQRRIMNQAFKKPALVNYLGQMNPRIADGLRAWQTGSDFRVFPAVKQLTLDLASRIFMGIEPGPEATRLNQAFVDTVDGSIAPVRFDLPGTTYRRGLRGREHLVKTFRGLLPQKRAVETPDFFSAFCHAESETGDRYTDEEIIDHMAFLMMAAHDTTTSTLTAMFFALAREPAWQERLREEAREFLSTTAAAPFDDVEERAFRRAHHLGLKRPISALGKPSRCTADIERQCVRSPPDMQLPVILHPRMPHASTKSAPSPYFRDHRFLFHGSSPTRYRVTRYRLAHYLDPPSFNRESRREQPGIG